MVTQPLNDLLALFARYTPIPYVIMNTELPPFTRFSSAFNILLPTGSPTPSNPPALHKCHAGLLQISAFSLEKVAIMSTSVFGNTETIKSNTKIIKNYNFGTIRIIKCGI